MEKVGKRYLPGGVETLWKETVEDSPLIKKGEYALDSLCLSTHPWKEREYKTKRRIISREEAEEWLEKMRGEEATKERLEAEKLARTKRAEGDADAWTEWAKANDCRNIQVIGSKVSLVDDYGNYITTLAGSPADDLTPAQLREQVDEALEFAE